MALGAILMGAPAIWLILRLENQPIMFSRGYVGVQPDYVRVIGSVIGDDKHERDRPINNGILMTCWRPDKTCRYLNVNEISSHQVGDIFDETLNVRKWDAEALVADSLDQASAFQGCNYYEIRVLLKTEVVTYTRLPNPKADKARCKALFPDSKQLRQWRISDGKDWGDYSKGD